MEDVLIICSDSEVNRLIESKIGPKTNLRSVIDPATALSSRESRFDLVFIDVTLMRDNFAHEFQQTIRHFNCFNPLVQFVALAPKEMVRQAVDAVRQGAGDYLTYPIDGVEVELVLETVKQNQIKNLELLYLRDKFWKSDWLDIIHTENPHMHRIFEKVRSVAPTIATVLLLGATGTGKGLMARLIHRHSHRSDGPFVSVHCGAIPETLIESELFGHERGAFTGAERRKIGKFEMAHDGTMFLDEIGTIAPAAQIKLLQVLQGGTFNRVGGTELLHTNARIIAATNADLQQMAESGAFRKDLYYRLNIFPIELPPLKDRMEDFTRLVGLFLANLNKKYGKNINQLQTGLADSLKAYHWPGNLRELENVLERAYILETSDVLRPDAFTETLNFSSKNIHAIDDGMALSITDARQNAVDEFERAYLVRLLKKHGGKINLSAKEADISTRQLNRLAAKHGMDKKLFKP